MKLSRVEKFILKVGTYEEKIFKRRSEVRERKLKRLIQDNQEAVSSYIFEKCTYLLRFNAFLLVLNLLFFVFSVLHSTYIMLV